MFVDFHKWFIGLNPFSQSFQYFFPIPNHLLIRFVNRPSIINSRRPSVSFTEVFTNV